MQESRQRYPGADRDQHQAILTGSGSGEQAFEVTLGKRNNPGRHRGNAADKSDGE